MALPEIPAEAGFRLELDGAVASIWLNRPERLNAQTPHTWRSLRQVGADLPGDVRVVLVRAEGPSFSSGLDRAIFGDSVLRDLAALPVEAAQEEIGLFQAAFDWLARPDLVSVAVVHGHAVGAGFQLALACDLRLAADDAQFTMAETTLGMVPDLGGTKRLVELVGYSRAAEICLTGRRIGAAEAYRIGLVSGVMPGDGMQVAVDELTAALLTPPRESVVETKALLLAASMRSQTEQERAESEAQHRLLRRMAGEISES